MRSTRARPPSSQNTAIGAVPGAVDQAADHRARAPDGQDPADVLLSVHRPQGGDDGHVGAAEDEGRGGGCREDGEHRQRRTTSAVAAGRASGLLVAAAAPERGVDDEQARSPATIDSHSTTKIEMAVSHDRRHPHPERRARHEGELGADRVERQGRAALLVGDRDDEDLAQDRERRHHEQSAERGQAHQPPVVDPRGDRPADRLDEQRGQDHAAQTLAVEQPAAPRAGDRERERRGRG